MVAFETGTNTENALEYEENYSVVGPINQISYNAANLGYDVQKDLVINVSHEGKLKKYTYSAANGTLRSEDSSGTR